MNKVVKSFRKRGFFITIARIVGTVVYKMIRVLADFIFNFLKVDDNLVVFTSFPDFSDNSKEYFLYLNEKYKTKKFVWLVKNCKVKYSYSNTKFVKNVSIFHGGPTLRALFYSSIASVIYYTHGSPIDKLKVKNDQLVINLWHGCGYKEAARGKKSFIEENYFDYVLVPGPIFVETKSKFFGCKKNKILDIGYPRYDSLIKDNEITESFISKQFKNNKIIIWMPTFRKTGNLDYPEENVEQNYDLPILSSNEDLLRINSICKKHNTILVIKRHPYQLKYLAEDEKLSNVLFIDNDYFFNNKIDMYSFLKYTDALITDYSSIAIDYLLLDQPIAFTLDDFETYQKSRGFVFENPLEFMPGHHIYDKENLIDFIVDVINENDVYAKDRKKIMKKVHNLCNNYCERIDKYIIDTKSNVRGNYNEKI